MPNLEHELHKLSRAVCYANFDLSHAYWQLPLAQEIQESQSFITPFGVFTPTRVLHATSNAVAHLEASVHAIIPSCITENTFVWL
eukprot:IDg20988t1